MKTKILTSVFVFTMLSFLSVSAQWVRQSPFPTGLHLNSVHFLTPDHGFAVGINHLLLETTDGGKTWITRMSDELGTDPFYRISFSNNLTGFISGSRSGGQNDLWQTTNGGVNWIQMSNFSFDGNWRLIDFTSPTHLYFGANGACVFSPDAGATWVIRSGYPDCPIMYGMDFRNDQVGLVGGNSAQNGDGIFKTTDGGVTWEQKHSAAANDVLWLTDNIAIATIATAIYRSTNAGDTWSLLFPGITTGLIELEPINNMNIAGVSGKGDIWRSTDGGLNWIQVFDGPGDLPTSWSINFVDPLHGWVVGQSGFIYASEDGGVTWRQVNNGAGIQIYDMEMLTNNFGIAACQNGYVFRTTNGGNFWETQKLEVTGQIFGRDESLHGISIVDSGFAVAAGPGGTVFRTYNGGINWQSIGYPDLPDPFWIEDVKFVNRNIGWLVGLDQDLGHTKTVYRTTDGGSTWLQAMSQSTYMSAVDFTDEMHGWIATIGYLYFRTTDGGSNWSSNTFPPYFITPSVSDIKFIDQNTGWAAGWDGFVARSTNGGVNWTYQNLGTTEDHIFSIYAVNENEAWLTGREADLPMNGVVYYTTNAGVNWTREITSPWPYWGYSITGSGGNVWISGYEGRIFKKSSTINVTTISEKLPGSYILSQNFPNPFNPSTRINFAIPVAEKVNLSVFDMLGQHLKTMVNENLNAGVYTIEFNGSEFSSGIYFYKLETFGPKKFFETRKMVLIK